MSFQQRFNSCRLLRAVCVSCSFKKKDQRNGRLVFGTICFKSPLIDLTKNIRRLETKFRTDPAKSIVFTRKELLVLISM